MTSDLDNLRKLEAAATPGPWRVDHDRNEQACIYAGEGTDEWVALLPHQCVASIEEARNHDAALIAAMRSALGPLLSVAQAAKAFEDAQERLEASNLTWGVSDETKAALRADRKSKRDTLLAAVRALKESK